MVNEMTQFGCSLGQMFVQLPVEVKLQPQLSYYGVYCVVACREVKK